MSYPVRRVESATLAGVQLVTGRTTVFQFMLTPAAANCSAVFYDGTDATGPVIGRCSALANGRNEQDNLNGGYIEAQDGVFVVTTGAGAIASVLVPSRRGL